MVRGAGVREPRRRLGRPPDPNILGLFPVFKGDVDAAVERAGLEPSAESVSKVVSDGFDECVWDAIGKSIDARVARDVYGNPAVQGRWAVDAAASQLGRGAYCMQLASPRVF